MAAHGPDTIDAAETTAAPSSRGLPVAEKGLNVTILASGAEIARRPCRARAHAAGANSAGTRRQRDGAQQQFQQALALAADYEPARKALRK